jgi:CubicO group peptidase (beta-lactamase class C family)
VCLQYYLAWTKDRTADTLPFQERRAAKKGEQTMAASNASRRNLLAAAIAGVGTGLGALSPDAARAGTDAGQASSPQDMAARIQGFIPDMEAEIARGMKVFDAPGLAIGIVCRDKLVYARGFGVRSRKTNNPVGTRTVFQIGSTTKAFLAMTLAMMVERGHLQWDDRIVDIDPDFALSDPWVTREFRVFDLLAQRSGLPPYANDTLGILGLDQAALIRSLRYVEPVSSFRSTFAYTNITHMLAGRIVAKAAGEADWNAVLQKEILTPLGMTQSSVTATAITSAPDHAEGYLWSPSGSVEVPFTQIFPYDFGGAGDINSTVEDMAQWLRLQIGDGSLGGRTYVSATGMAATRTPKVSMSDTQSYALGWVVRRSANGTVIWHNGGTSAFGAFVGFLPDHGAGVVILTNSTNVGLPDAIGTWVTDRMLDNPTLDYIGIILKRAQDQAATSARTFARPTDPRPTPPLSPLAGHFANPAIGRASVVVEDKRLIMTVDGTGARLSIEPWDGDVFTALLLAEGRFADIAANLGPSPNAFVQYQIGDNGGLDRLKLSFDDGQAYVFDRTPATPG